jgi:hypothetical protein
VLGFRLLLIKKYKIMKIAEINGKKYSRGSFEDYKLRAKVEFKATTGIHNIDIYTTETDKEKVWDDILETTTDKVQSFSIVHWATKEQDDLSSKFIDEWLNEA